MTRMIDEYIVHCSATKPTWMADKTIFQKRDEIRLWHVRDRGWSDIGYAGLFDFDGSIAPGRDLDKDGNYFNDIGAHTGGRNSRSIGGCLIGGYGSSPKDLFEDHFTPDQDRALRRHIEEAEDYAKRKLIVSGHNQYANKACPGFYVPDWYARKYQKPLIGFQDKNLMRDDYEPAPVASLGQTKTQQQLPVLRMWSKEKELVRALQTRLKELRYFPGKVDGKYGPKTYAAVSAFQTDNGLVLDGEVGQQTRAALEIAVPRALRDVKREDMDESRTVKNAKKGKRRVAIAGAASVLPVGVSEIEEVVQVIEQARSLTELLGGLAPMTLAILGVGAAVFFGWRAFSKIEDVRYEDALTGANSRI